MRSEKHEFILFTLWRYLATYTGYVLFGCGALLLMGVGFPVLRLMHMRSEKKELHEASRRLTNLAFRIFVFYVRFTGAAKIDMGALKKTEIPSTGAILVANHPTLLDYVFIASVFPTIDCVVRSTLLNNPFLSGIIRACGYLTNDDPETIFEECHRRFRQGDALLIFPEGTRSVPGKAAHLHRGAAQLALRCNVPVIAIHIECSEWWLGKQLPWYTIPAKQPQVALSYVRTLESNDFLTQEKSTALAARRLTEELQQILFTRNSTEINHGLSRKPDQRADCLKPQS